MFSGYLVACARGVRGQPFSTPRYQSAVALYVGMAQGVSFSLYINIEAKFQNTHKTGERVRRAEYRTVVL